MAAGNNRKKQALQNVYDRLYDVFGDLHCTLDYETPHQLLVATILSAQCTDARVNKLTPALFAKYDSIRAFADADLSEMEEMVRPAGFFRHKAENIIKSAQQIMERHQGIVPDRMEDLVKLGGVGRKTANVILGDAFEVPGFPVDTHVKRVLKRLGLTSSDDPEKIEHEINVLVPESRWVNFSHMLIMHGRGICDARKPRCEECILNEDCAFYRKGKKQK